MSSFFVFRFWVLEPNVLDFPNLCVGFLGGCIACAVDLWDGVFRFCIENLCGLVCLLVGCQILFR